jgi:hypothetical protein
MAVENSKIERMMLHLGEQRTVKASEGERPVTLEEANLDCKVLKQLLRWGGETRSTGKLTAWGRNRSFSATDIDESLARLTEWNFVRLAVNGNRATLSASLTSAGLEWARKLIARANEQARTDIEATAQ